MHAPFHDEQGRFPQTRHSLANPGIAILCKGELANRILRVSIYTETSWNRGDYQCYRNTCGPGSTTAGWSLAGRAPDDHAVNIGTVFNHIDGFLEGVNVLVVSRSKGKREVVVEAEPRTCAALGGRSRKIFRSSRMRNIRMRLRWS